jgi:ERCC4-type nuclease
MNYSKITVDYREKSSGVHDLLKNCGAFVKIAKLSYGDYIINDQITVERKTADGFLLSIKVMSASVQDLSKIDGIGKISAEKVREVLDTEVR